MSASSDPDLYSAMMEAKTVFNPMAKEQNEKKRNETEWQTTGQLSLKTLQEPKCQRDFNMSYVKYVGKRTNMMW